MSKRTLFLLFSFVLTTSLSAEVKRIKATETKTPPVIDGKLIDNCWQFASQANNFSTFSQPTDLASEQTIGYVLYDNENLYIGFRCLESKMDLLREVTSKSSGKFNYAEGEDVEIFIDKEQGKKTYFQIIVNTNGSYQVYPEDYMQVAGIEKRIKAVVFFDKDAFYVEVEIPFSVLHLTQQTKDTWGFNLCRARMIETGIEPNRMYSAWQNTGGAFGRPDRFGELEIDKDFSPYCYGVDISKDALRIKNDTGRKRSLMVDLTITPVEGKQVRLKRALSIDDGEEKTLKIGLPNGAKAEVVLGDVKTGETYYYGGTQLLDITPIE